MAKTYTVKFSDGTVRELENAKNKEEATQEAQRIALDEGTLANLSFVIIENEVKRDEERKEEEKRQKDQDAYEETSRPLRNKRHIR